MIKDIKDQVLRVAKEQDLIVIYKNTRRVLRLPKGAAVEFALGLKVCDRLANQGIVASDDDGTPISLSYADGLIYVRRGNREAFVLRPLHAAFMGECIEEALK